MKKIAVISQNRGFLGAQIVHIPLIRALRELYPDSEIAYFSKNNVSSILHDLGIIDGLVLEKSKIHFLRKYIKFSPNITINLRKKSYFHILMIAIFNRGKKISFSGFLSNFFFNKTKKSNTLIYRAENYLSLIDKKLKYRKTDKKDHIVLIPGAGGKHKIWNIKNYIKLADLIKKSFPQFEIIFILGNKEKQLLSLLKDYNYFFNREIQKDFKEIEESILVITNDCGPSHIAHISDVNVISIISDEKNNADGIIKEWINTDKKTRIIKSKKFKSINSICVEEVYKKAAEILEELEKSPPILTNKIDESATS